MSKLTLFTSLERNIFILSSISIALFGISVTSIELQEGKILCKLGAIFIAMLSTYNIYIANNYLHTNNSKQLLSRLNRSAKLYTIILVLLCFVFIYSMFKHDIFNR